MRIAICDDEEAQRLLIQRYVEAWAADNKVALETELFASGEVSGLHGRMTAVMTC